MFLCLLYVELLLSLHCYSHLLHCNNNISYRVFNHTRLLVFSQCWDALTVTFVITIPCTRTYFKNWLELVIIWINKSDYKSTATLKQSLLQNTEDVIHLTDQRYPTEDNRLSNRFRPPNSPYILLVSVQFVYFYKWWSVKKRKKEKHPKNPKPTTAAEHPTPLCWPHTHTEYA